MSTSVDAKHVDLLLEKVYREGGFDFRDYRRGTVIRRLERRLRATNTKTCPDYIEFLEVHPEEYERFAECLTIKVSDFFRNSYAFQQLSQWVLPDLISEKRKHQDHSLRVWSTACAKGEEPYSIAILLADFLGPKRQDFNISVYATDISRQALNEAKAGIYPSRDVQGLSDTILENYFNRVSEHYQVKAEMKQMIHFSSFDLTSLAPPPFTNLDLIFCCNVLIYLEKQLQKRVLEMLYDSLHSQGHLILGESEAPFDNLHAKFVCLERKAKIYKKAGIDL